MNMVVANSRSDARLVLCMALISMAILVWFIMTPAAAQKLYKVVDENGNISYQDMPPMTNGSKVEEKHIDVNSSMLRHSPPPPRKSRPTRAPTRAATRPAVGSNQSAPGSDPGMDALKGALGSAPSQSNTPKKVFIPQNSADLNRYYEEQREAKRAASGNATGRANDTSPTTDDDDEFESGPYAADNSRAPQGDASMKEFGNEGNENNAPYTPTKNDETDPEFLDDISSGDKSRVLTPQELLDIARQAGKQ